MSRCTIEENFISTKSRKSLDSSRLVSSQTHWHMSYELPFGRYTVINTWDILTNWTCRGSVTVRPGHQRSEYCMRHNEGNRISALKFNAAESRPARFLH
jgi:hypothetical protein